MMLISKPDRTDDLFKKELNQCNKTSKKSFELV